MESLFQKTLAAVEQDTCYTSLAEYESTILSANSKLNAYYASVGSSLEVTSLKFFTDTCANNKCGTATDMIASSISGSSLFHCDMMNILYYSDVKSGYY
jgi:hypothetical protein